MTAEQWNQVLTAIGVVFVAIRTELRGRAAQREHKNTQNAVAGVAVAVNGPLAESLRATAAALTHVAHLTGSEEDILAAVEARKRSDQHAQRNAEIAEFKRERDLKMKATP